MRILRYTTDGDATDPTGTLCLELEAALGVNLSVHDLAAPNDVHGYLNTGSDGTVEVYLYEPADVLAIEAMPEVVRFAKCPECGGEQNDWTDPDVCEDCGDAIDFSKGRASSLRGHSGIYAASMLLNDALAVSATDLLFSKGFDKHPDGDVVTPNHAVDACSRAATKVERGEAALVRREERLDAIRLASVGPMVDIGGGLPLSTHVVPLLRRLFGVG